MLQKSILFLFFSFVTLTACAPALPKEPEDPMEFKKNAASVNDMLAESYKQLKKSENLLHESREILKEVKLVEEHIIETNKKSLMNLSQAKKEKNEADKIRKRAVAEKRRIEKEIKAMKEATPTPTPVPTTAPYSKSDAP